MIKVEKEKTCCVTGYRPMKCPWGFNEKDSRCMSMKEYLNTALLFLITNYDYRNFFVGMALGFDMICAETLLNIKKVHKDIKIYGALPCKKQEVMWNSIQQERYRNILSKLDDVYIASETYTGVECMHKRNQYMVDNSSYMIALYDGKSGGTQKTVEYAIKQGLQIEYIKPNEF